MSDTTRQTIVVRLDPEWHKRLKVEAAKRGRSMKDLMISALEAYLSRRPS